MIRWFWRAYTCVAVGSLILLWGGPFVETHLFPIRGAQSIKVVERTDSRLCWTWTFVKRRETWSDNLDAFIEINGDAAGVVAPYDRDSGFPWGVKRLSVAARPEPYTLTHCVALPPAVKPQDAIRIRQVAYYPGFMNLWQLSVAFPDVNSLPQD